MVKETHVISTGFNLLQQVEQQTLSRYTIRLCSLTLFGYERSRQDKDKIRTFIKVSMYLA